MEILTVLVITGIIAAAAVPNIMAWLASSERESQRQLLAGYFASLPLQAKFSGKSIVVNSVNDIKIDDLSTANTSISIDQTISVFANGFCAGGEVTLMQSEFSKTYKVTPPFCELIEVNN